MKVALLCFLLFAVCFAQTSSETLSLSQTFSQGRSTQRSDSVDDELVRSGCRTNVHRVVNVQRVSNSGSYFSVFIDNQSDDETLKFTFGLPGDDDDEGSQLFDISETRDAAIIDGDGFTGECGSGDECLFIYKCEQYPNVSELEVIVFSDESTSDDSDELVLYSLNVTQYIEEVDEIGQTFNEPSVTVTFDDEAIGPSNYAQYYHNLDTTLAENAAESVLYVIVSDFDDTYDGEVSVCVSFDSMVSNSVENSDVDDNDVQNELEPQDPETINDDNCQSFCQSADIDTEGDFVFVALDLCDRGCVNTEMWIGVQPESGESTGFTITVQTDERILDSLIQVEDTPFVFEGEVSDECVIDDFNFSCDNYFVINSDTDFDSPSDSRLGPYLSVHVYGPLGGEVKVDFTSGSLGGNNFCDCGTSLPTNCNSLSADNGDDISCVFTVPPCQFDQDAEYVVTVTGVDQDFGDDTDAPQFIDYGIEIKLDSYPVQDVNPISTVFGEVAPGQQNHYTVTFESEEINPDSYFEVELYARNSDGENLALAWNFDEPAGDGTCFQNLGVCQTDLACDDFNGVALAAGTVPTCRFVYEDCDIDVSETFARTGGDDTDFTQGARVSQLRAGTYWFNVYHATTSGSFANVDTSVEYTLKFNLRRSIPVFDNLVILGQVHFAESTPQYVYNVPNTAGIRDIVVTVDNVRNGGVTVYVECGARAGNCPSSCGTNFDGVSAAQGDMNRARGQIVVPVCACDAETLNIVVVGTTSPADGMNSFSVNQPIFFTLSVDTFASELEVLPLPATRAGTTASGTITQFGPTGLTQRDQIRDDVFLYELSFDNVDIQSNDALFLTLDMIVETEAEPPLDVSAVRMSVGEHAVYGLDAVDCGQVSCTAFSHPSDPNPATAGQFSTCTIDIQPCVAECSDSSAFDVTRRYIVSITALDENALEDRILFSVTAQVVGNVPIPLQDAVPFRGEQLTKRYNHFSFSVADSPSNSRLVMEAYTDAAAFPMVFFANYFDGVGAPVPAGRDEDCFGHSFCYTCEIGFDGNNRCGYEVPPCVLSGQTGQYFLSVNNDESEDMNTLPYAVDFTIEARYIDMINVLDAERVLVGSIAPYESAYYQIDVPQGNLDVLRFEFEAASPSVRFGVSTTMPDEQCSGCVGFNSATEGSAVRTTFYPCADREETYYLTVTVDTTPLAGESLTACERFDFIVHAHAEQITRRSISLTTDSDSEFISRSYDSTLETDDELVLDSREIVVYQFSASNVNPGDFLVIETDQVDDNLMYEVNLSQDSPFYPDALVDDFGLAGSCGTALGTCQGQDDVCRIIVKPCSFSSGTYFLTFSGQDSEPTAEINLSIRHFSAVTLDVPDEGESEMYTFADDTEFDDIGFRSFVTGSMGIDGGDVLAFSTDASEFFVRRNGEVESDDGDSSTSPVCAPTCGGEGERECELYACVNSPSRPFYIVVSIPENGPNDVEITIDRVTSDNTSDLGIIDFDTNESQMGPAQTGDVADGTAQFQYYRVSVEEAGDARDRSQSGRFEFILKDVNQSDLFFFEDNNQRVFFPGFEADETTEFVINGDEVGATCGGVNGLPSGTCCYPEETFVFAVAGADEAYSITVEEERFGSTPVSASFSRTYREEIETDEPLRFDQYTFDLGSDQDLLYVFDVTSGSATVYINEGVNAGSFDDSDDTDPSRCFGNDGTVDCSSIDAADEPCVVYRPACDSTGCPTSGLRTFTIAVVPDDRDADVVYTLVIEAVDPVENIDNNNDDLQFPPFDTDILPDGTLSDLTGVRAVFRYEVDSSFSSANTIPRTNSLGLDEELYPRLRFLFTNFRDSNGPVDDRADLTIEVDASGSSCNDDPQSLANFCEGDTFVANATTIVCEVDACDLSCNQVIYFFVESSEDETFEFDLDVSEQFDNIDPEEGQFLLRTLNVPNSVSNEFTDQGDEPVYSVFITTSFSNVPENRYPVLTLSVTGEGSFELYAYGADTCSATAEAVAGCETLDGDESCTIVYDPCSSQTRGIFDQSVTFEIRKSDQDDVDWEYDFSVITRTVSVIDGSATQLSPSGTTSYSATKEILENTWQFYQFEISTNDGYTTLDVDVNGFACQSDNGDGIDVYYSWGTPADSFIDVARPLRFPTEDCNVIADTSSSGSSSDTIDTCQFHGGIYRVGIFANERSQLFDDEDDGDEFDETIVLPVQYSISATLTTLPHIQATLGCALVQPVNDFVARIELPIEATTRYARLAFGLETEDGLTFNMVVARSGYSEGIESLSECMLSDYEFSQSCSATGGDPCFVEIPSCGSVDGLWFVYISTEDDTTAFEDGTVTFYSYIEELYVPVLDVGSSQNVESTFALPEFTEFAAIDDALTSAYSQVHEVAFGEGSYEIVVEPTITCDGACDFDVVFFPEANARGECSGEDCDIPLDAVCNTADDGLCREFFSSCDFRSILVMVSNGGADCQYTIRVNRFTPNALDAVVVTPDSPACDITGCSRLYQLQVPNGDLADQPFSFEIDNQSSDEISYFFGNDFDCQTPTLCAAGATDCGESFDGCSLVQEPFYVFVFTENCNQCTFTESSISVSMTLTEVDDSEIDIDDGELGDAADQVRFTVPDGEFVRLSGGYTNYAFASGPVEDFSLCAASCERVINGGTTGRSVVVQDPSANFAVETIDIESLDDGEEFEVVFDGSTDVIYFSFEVPTGATDISVSFSSLNAGPVDPEDPDDLPEFSFTSAGDAVPSDCPADTCGDSDSLSLSACGRAFDTEVVDQLCGVEILYFAIQVCEPVTCPVSMTVVVSAQVSESVSAFPGGDHGDDYELVLLPDTAGLDCDDLDDIEPLSFVVEVSSILFVSVREPLNFDGDYAVTATISSCDGPEGSCVATQTSVGQESSCAIADDCDTFCRPAGTYTVTFAADAPGRFEYQIINQWVDLNGSDSGTLYGEAAHFYRIVDANQALSVALTVNNGPAVEFTVREACSSDGIYIERQVCHFGTCHIWLPTRSENPGQNELYVVIESGLMGAGGNNPDLANTEFEKITDYDIEVTRGTANCGTAPSSGFCSDDSIGGVNSFAALSNSQVWTYENVTAKQDQAECYYQRLLSGCPSPTGLCREYLKTFACLNTFPQCDANGYQMGVCNDICLQIEDACGDYDFGGAGIVCGSGRFAPASNGTCVTSLPINGPVTTTSVPQPARRLEAVEEVDVLPAQLVVPQFPPLYATLPTLVLDDDEDAKMLVQKQVQDSSSASNLMVAVTLVFAMFLLAF